MPPPQNALAYQHPPTSLRPVPLQSAAVEPWLASKWPPKTTNPAHAAPAARVPSSTPTTLPTAKRCQVYVPHAEQHRPNPAPAAAATRQPPLLTAVCSRPWLQHPLHPTAALQCCASLHLEAAWVVAAAQKQHLLHPIAASTLHPTAPLRLTAAHHCTSKLRGPLPSR